MTVVGPGGLNCATELRRIVYKSTVCDVNIPPKFKIAPPAPNPKLPEKVLFVGQTLNVVECEEVGLVRQVFRLWKTRAC